ncbi:MAG: hypothetical protein R3195_12495 [Gemmatimonadota bacterium]|nr:hypothetical protein [Gemmatimonadota bacterium]
MRALVVLTLSLSLTAALACGGDATSSDDVVRTDSAGVEIVVSPSVDRPIDLSPTELFRLGGEDTGPASFTRVAEWNVDADAAGNLYVLDGNAFRIVVFSPDGEHLRSMGSEGEGPGELQFPSGMSVTPDGEAVVFDIGKRALVPYGPDGTARQPIQFPYYTDPGVRHFRRTGTDVLVTRSITIDEDRRGNELIAFSHVAGSPDTVTLARIEYDRPEMVEFDCMALMMRPLFEPVIRWRASEDLVAVVTDAGYRVDLFGRDGALVRSIRRDLPVREASMEDAVAEAEPGMRMMGQASCEASAREVAEGRGFVPALPAIRDVLIATDGTLWVERFEPGGRAENLSGPIDLFDASGAYMGTLPAGTRFPIALLPGDRIAVAEKDAFDVERLVVLRVSATEDLESAP